MQYSRPWILAGIIVLIVVFTAIQLPPSLPWTPVYDAELTWPRASKAVFEYLEQRTTGPLKINEERPSTSMPLYRAGTWIFVTQSFDPDSSSFDRICKSVRNGAVVFIAAERFGERVRDTFEFSISMCFPSDLYLITDSIWTPMPDTKDLIPHARIGVDSGDGWRSIFENPSGVFAAVRPFGNGRVIVSNLPDVWTNNALLYDGHDDVLNALLQRLPGQHITWDQHYKPDAREGGAVLSVLTSYPGLHFAYWVLVIMGLGTVLVNTKRRQRAIAVVPAMMDSAVEFVNQIAMVFWNRRDHRAVARQLLRQFRTHLVRRYRLQHQQITVSEANVVARYTDCDAAIIARLLHWSEDIDNVSTMSESELQQLHHDLEHFFSLSPP